MKPRLAFIGAGRMAGAMVRGLLKTGPWNAEDIVCTGARDGTAEALSEDTGIRFTYDWKVFFKDAQWVILACKPQQLKELPESLSELSSGRRVLSILAGTTLGRLKKVFPGTANIVRTMPNTPGMIGAGISAYSPLHPMNEEDEQVVRAILSALGEAVSMDEHFLDAVTGVSGSGPAYVFEFIAALRDGGVAAGLDEATAYKLALKTVQGAAALLEAVPETPETHRNWVSSPGGTTLAGLKVMEDAGFRGIIKETVAAATKRSKELSGE
ncbi:pyrroline-5-carboxylate reductase [Puniceicoccales bacterium CK1056]|uniref:Pyrroline-5-carboxylate reductase n=1 Tax=Oceanipulchritudo coccoides TaxID=2706888 RepID=A0A6B2M0X2_9BACT|nr:pyrroline-5-carboxylate reductase [Oceanipulchritudo coccoides]NDV62006.1 pyrroline-5-carboxylate reductase [Oceanipulchritudo coccoides]